MRHESSKRGTKTLLLLVVILGTYLAFFGFDITRAVDFTFSGAREMLKSFGL